MEKNNLQTTVKQLEEFLSAYYRKTGVRPTLGEALDMMEKDNLLSAPPAVAAADSKVQHTVEEICEIIDSQPVNATAFLQNTSPSESGTAHVSGEDAIFAPGRDVTVTRVFSYLSADAAEYDCFTIAVVLKRVRVLLCRNAHPRRRRQRYHHSSAHGARQGRPVRCVRPGTAYAPLHV